MSFKTIILAAGKGTRMKSKLPKVLHKVGGKEMLNHVIDISKKAGSTEVVAIVGHESELVKEKISKDVHTVYQEEQLGTAHAVKCASSFINDGDEIVVLCGDTPLVNSDTLKNLYDYHKKNNYYITVLSTEKEDPMGYGRIIRDGNGDLLRIVEEKDADDEQKKVREINSGIYCFDGKELKEALDEVNNDNAQGEYYLPDVIEIMRRKSLKVGAFKGATIEELMGVNSRVDLAKAEEIFRIRVNTHHMENGVTILDPKNTYIDADVTIGSDTIIYPNVRITGKTVIGEDSEILSGSSIDNSTIGNNVVINHSTIVDSKVGDNTKVGPFAYLRPKSNIGKGCKIGDFVEVKNANFGDGSKASHLSYIGDADVGKNVNIGCGVVFVNYDGVNKFRSTVKDNAFVGSNSNLVAPVVVEEGGYIATGSTITKTVPDGALSVARARQTNIEGWVEKKFGKKD